MDIVKLRTLTEKSIVPYGRYKGARVQTLLQVKKFEIAYLYYYVQWITFTEDVLEAANIFKDRRIEKPGVNRDMWDYYVAANLTHGRGTNKVARNIANKRLRTQSLRRMRESINDENLSASQLQAINHGHVKGTRLKSRK